ncbi:MAG TPA: NAD(P)(+) transhydrogenase (Re/Si-specific) subunit beta, partial [Acetobacteraceae bacterium]|nr:NAD(P)(+) transhydrogenase (Re/Si-specific) subunit beta [Acetobacteraceae bacterium]
MSASTTTLLYLVAAILFILALRGLSHPVTSRRGNMLGMCGMGIAIIATLAHAGMSGLGYVLIVLGIAIGGSIGTFIALRIQMTALPQLVAAFHSLVGLAAVFVAAAALNGPAAFGIANPLGGIYTESLIEMSIGLAIGAITFSGSVIAFAKLQALMRGAPVTFKYQHPLNGALGALLLVLIILFIATGGHQVVFWLIAILAIALGFLLIIPIGGADMPVIVSMLNSYSGWAACGIGFTIQNLALIITGALVGASGAILSYIMCKGMNRSIINVLLGGFGTDVGGAPAAVAGGDRSVRAGSAEDAAFIMKNASKVIVVPGYGMAVAQAQHALREMADTLKKEGVEVKYAIHPV